MTDLTARAQANLARGATVGAGTDTCASCHRPKESRRLNSTHCRSCARGAVNHAVKVSLPTDVFEALSADAARTGVTAAARVEYLLNRKYRKD